MKKLLEKRAKSIVVVVALFVIINVALSFAYIRGGSVGSESVSTVALEGGSINVRYSSNSGSIVASDIVPGYETTKQFTITSEYGEGHEYYDLGLWYQINLVVDKNEFGDGSLTYSLSLDEASDDDGVPATNVEYAPIPSGQNLQGILVGAGRLINDNKSHIYNFKITYAETLTDQSEEIGSKFEAHITLTNPKIVKIIFDLDGGEIQLTEYNKITNSLTSATNSFYTLPIPYKAGYSFNGWEIISGNGSLNGNILRVNEENITLKASYKIPSFATDSWETIAQNVRNGNTRNYVVGDTRTINLYGYTNNDTGLPEEYTLRLANNSHYDGDCTLESKTACGFVVEFVDIVEKRAMNSSATNFGGWPATAVRTYLNGEFKEKLPGDLQSVIVDTTVVSGHGSNQSNNFTSIDKLYLLSIKEVLVDGSSNAVSGYDSAYNSTRQLDYYLNKGLTTSNYSGAIKNYAGSPAGWWLRGATSHNNVLFFSIITDGSWNNGYANDTAGGLAPAFHIG